MVKKWIVIVCFVLLLSGCWDERILDETGLITVITMDDNEEDIEGILMTASYPEFVPGTKQQEVKLGHKARTTREALKNLNRLTDKQLVTGQIQVLLVGEDYAREKGVHHILDTLERDVEFSSNIHICVTEGKANEFLKKGHADKPLDGFYIAKLIEKQVKISELPATHLHVFEKDLHSNYTDPIAPFLRLKTKGISAAETAVFQGDRFVGVMGSEETQLLVMLRNDGTTSELTKQTIVDGKQMYATISFIGSHTDIKTSKKYGTFQFDIVLNVKASLLELEGTDVLLKGEEIFEEIGKQFSELLTKKTEEMVIKFQKEQKADPIGLGEFIRSSLEKDTTEKEWREQYLKSEINVDVKVNVVRDGDFPR